MPVPEKALAPGPATIRRGAPCRPASPQGLELGLCCRLLALGAILSPLEALVPSEQLALFGGAASVRLQEARCPT